MKYAIFSDIDGTIYSHSQEFHKDTKKDIKMAQDKGIEFILATGNPYFSQTRWLSKELDVDYYIGSNGAVTIDVKKDKIIHTSKIGKEDANKILQVANSLELSADWWSDEKLYWNKYAGDELKDILKRVILKDDVAIEAMEIDYPIHKIEFFDDPIKVDKAIEMLKDLDLKFARMKPHHVEITTFEASKGNALKWLSNHLGIEIENTMAIGDSANDWSMLEVGGHTYAMGNANDETKSKAKCQTRSVEDNGLGIAIHEFINKIKK